MRISDGKLRVPVHRIAGDATRPQGLGNLRADGAWEGAHDVVVET